MILDQDNKLVLTMYSGKTVVYDRWLKPMPLAAMSFFDLVSEEII